MKIKEKHNNVYAFKLDFELGYSYCLLQDFTNIQPFSGIMLSIFDLVSSEINIQLDDFKKLNFLFRPAPLFNFPKSRGKDKWTLIGKLPNEVPMPAYKDVRGDYTRSDWSKLDHWAIIRNLEDYKEVDSYEEVRTLEIPIMNSEKSIIIRTTMEYLWRDGKKIGKYYDLNDELNRNIFIRMINISIPPSRFEEFHKELENSNVGNSK